MTTNLGLNDLAADASNVAGSGATRGIAIIANDKILDWLLPFLESYKATNASIPLYLIPYNDNHERTKRVAELYGVNFVDIDCTELDALSKHLYPFSLGKRYRLRKLLSLVLPLDEVIYFDVDIILFRDFSPLFGQLAAGRTEFIVCGSTMDYVYNRKAETYAYLRDAPRFNDGFFMTSKSLLSIEDFHEAMRQDEAAFHAVRKRGGLYAQPLTNFVVHRKGLKIVSFHELIPGASAQAYHKAEGVTFDADGLPIDEAGGQIYFSHWPGVTGLPTNRVFDPAWKDFARLADIRAKAAGL